MQSDPKYSRFRDFYPFYLGEHAHPVSRRLHFVGTLLVIATTLALFATGRWSLFWLLPLFGYGFAWAGHFFFEKNRPATFKHPWYSLIGDFAMFRDMLLGRIPL